jgi:hypothetical protein
VLDALRVFDDDMIVRLAMSHGDIVARPVAGNAWGDGQYFATAGHTQESLKAGAGHPGGRAGIPGPAPTAGVRGDTVHVGGDDVGLDAIAVDALRTGAVEDGI